MKIRRPAEVPEPKGPVPQPYDKARQAAIEKKKTPYIALECGHQTTWDDDELYSHWRSGKNKFFCESCGKWRARLHKRKARKLPDEPLF